MARWEEFRPCPHCSYDFGTGEGERACHWGECPYMPEALDVFCERCRFDLLTMEGNPACEEPGTCEDAAAAREHVANYRRWAGIAEPRGA